MTSDEIINPADLIHGLRASGKAGLLEELSRRAGDALGLDRSVILSALLRREDLGSTGIGGGIALPHARIEGIARPYGILARLRDALDFEAIDERPVDLVVLLLLPAGAEGETLNALARIARLLRDPDVAAGLRSARDAAGLASVLAAREG